jgi:hypothetical protein
MNNIVKEKHYIVNSLKGQLAQVGMNRVSYENLSQSYLRSEKALATQAEIKFALQKNQQGTAIVTEKLLELNDIFVATHVGVRLKRIAADAPTENQHQVAPLYTYENPQVFAGTNSPNVAAIYNGNFNWTINRKVFMPAFPMQAFRRVPGAQSSLQLLAAGTAATPAATFSPGGLDGYDNGLYGFYPLEPTVLDGRQTQDIVIELGASIAMDDSEITNYAVLEVRGYLVVNAKD